MAAIGAVLYALAVTPSAAPPAATAETPPAPFASVPADNCTPSISIVSFAINKSEVAAGDSFSAALTAANSSRFTTYTHYYEVVILDASFAVVDDGFHAEHEDLRDNVDATKNSANSGGLPLFDATLTHGTEVAGLIAARDNNLRVRGVVPRDTIYGFDLTIGSKTVDENDKARAAAHQRAVTALYNNS